MNSVSYEEQAERIATLLHEKLGIRGRDLESRLRRAGRLLPRHLQQDGAVLVEAVKYQASPKLARLVDAAQVARSYRNLEEHLQSIDPWKRRIDELVGILSGVAFSLLLTVVGFVALAYWFGLI